MAVRSVQTGWPSGEKAYRVPSAVAAYTVPSGPATGVVNRGRVAGAVRQSSPGPVGIRLPVDSRTGRVAGSVVAARWCTSPRGYGLAARMNAGRNGKRNENMTAKTRPSVIQRRYGERMGRLGFLYLGTWWGTSA